MKFRFTIAKKLAVGFGILTIALVINTVLTNKTLNQSREVNQEITNVYAPSSSYLNQLYEMITNSKMLIKNWVFIEQTPMTPDKMRLRKLHSDGFPKLDEQLSEITQKWDPGLRKQYMHISKSIKDTIFQMHETVMNQLSDFENYEDPMVMFEIQPMVEEGGEIMVATDNVLEELSELTEKIENITADARKNMVNTFDSFQRFIIIMGIGLFLAVIIIAVVTTRALVKPINYMKNVLLAMGKGIMPKEKIKDTNDEIGEMALALNALVSSLKEISNFALEVGKENFTKEFKPLSEDDKLGYSLIEMRDNLRKAAEEEEKRKKEDEQRQWASNGVAMFSDILRKHSNDLDALAYDVISNLVKYIGANLGGMFIINDDNKNDVYIEMKACYAYDRQKHLEKRIDPGVGLIGRCVQEKETIYITDVPEDYLNIKSGLGNEKPSSLLIVPLVMNEKIYGVIEIASFEHIEKYQIEFTERIAESIASTISSVKTNIQTKGLLEKSQRQAEAMKSQEEEMRQNMEELKATQEQAERKEKELLKKIDALKKNNDNKY